MKKRARRPAMRSVPVPGSSPITCGYHPPPLRILAGVRPARRIGQRRRERDVDAFLPELIVLGAVEQHHVLLEIRVPVNRRPPEDVVGRSSDRETAAGCATSGVPSGYDQPVAGFEWPVATRRRSRPWPSPPARRDRPTRSAPTATPCRGAVTHVLAVIEIEILAVGIERRRDVADATEHESIVRVAGLAARPARRGRCRGLPTSGRCRPIAWRRCAAAAARAAPHRSAGRS